MQTPFRQNAVRQLFETTWQVWNVQQLRRRSLKTAPKSLETRRSISQTAWLVTEWQRYGSFIHSAVCLTTGPQPLPQPVLHTVRYSASTFNLQYPIFFLRSCSSYALFVIFPSLLFVLLYCTNIRYYDMKCIHLAWEEDVVNVAVNIQFSRISANGVWRHVQQCSHVWTVLQCVMEYTYTLQTRCLQGGILNARQLLPKTFRRGTDNVQLSSHKTCLH